MPAGARPAQALELSVPERAHRTLWGDTWVQFQRNRLALFGMLALLGIVLFAYAGPLLWTISPRAIDIADASQPPSRQHPFGTDQLGRDLLARDMHGGRISLAVGMVSMAIAMAIGVTIGLVSGYVRRLDGLLMRFTDMMFALPTLPLLLVVGGLFQESLQRSLGQRVGAFVLLVTVIALLGWMTAARIVRGNVLSIRESEYVAAATNVGVGKWGIMLRHILPNVLGVVIVAATLSMAAAILSESTLSYLGMGFPSDEPTWGRLLFEGKDSLAVNPWISFWPGLLISLTILSINFMGDGLRDALDPRQRQ
jgi:peptide/nickel transport system permease protein